MIRLLIIGVFCTTSYNLIAQPFIDLVNVRYLNSPDAGLWRRNYTANTIKYYNFSTTLPIQFKKSKDVLVLSPYYEHWDIKLKGNVFGTHPNGYILPISFIKQLHHPNWKINTTFIVRNNAESFSLNHAWQYGGFVLANYKRNSKLTFKFGLYYNREAFGNFFVPLLGLDWTPTPTLNIWGTLPGTLMLEKKWSSKWYGGFSFRAITNSYQNNNGSFVRIDDNILGGYIDYYFTPKFLLNAEIGHSVFRRIRYGQTNASSKYFYTDKVNDNIYFKISAAYRIRL
jgi:hypothetical protein